MTATPALAAEKYVVITTRKKSGDLVSTPVWIAPLADGAMGFTTELSSGKVKRIRNFASVTVQPCNARGVPKPGSAAVGAQATILTGPEVDPVHRAIREKYGVVVAAISVMSTVQTVVKRRPSSERAAIRLVLD